MRIVSPLNQHWQKEKTNVEGNNRRVLDQRAVAQNHARPQLHRVEPPKRRGKVQGYHRR